MTYSVEPRCEIYQTCGGCQYQHLSYTDELKAKTTYLQECLAKVINVNIIEPIIPSPLEYYYRNRLDLRINRFKNEDIKIGFFPEGIKHVVPVNECPIASPDINAYLDDVKAQALKRFRPRYKQANLVIRTGDGKNPAWGGIGEGSLRQPSQDYFWTTIQGFRIHYSLETFFQANLSILPKVFDVLYDLPIWSPDALFFDLYGGVGLFGIGLSPLVKRVALIEQNTASVYVASYNKDYNHIENFDLYDGDVEFVLPKLFKYYGDGPKIVMVDPPRAGLTKEAVAWINQLQGVKHLLYLSCQPQSLARNLKAMSSRWQVRRIIPFDFFPKTRHIETLVWLESHTVA